MINKASCLCGSVTWEITTEPFQAFNCHCKLCRKAHGSAFGTYWFMRPDQFRWTGPTDAIAHYRSSHLLTRSSCGTCGSVVPYPSETKDLIVSLGGCHDRGKKSDCNIFVAHNAPWHDITGPLPRHDDYPPPKPATCRCSRRDRPRSESTGVRTHASPQPRRGTDKATEREMT